jgi:Transglutaminase-like superfamily
MFPTTLIRNAGDLFLFLRILAFSASVPVLMRLKLVRLDTLLLALSRPKSGTPTAAEKIKSYLELAIRFGRPAVRPGCLTRGVTLYYFLRREAGIEVALCFGMRQRNSNFEGHCWLVRDGKPFWETRDRGPVFAEIYRFPSSTSRLCARAVSVTNRESCGQ